MKIFYRVFSVAFLLPFFSLAQSNYKPGYVVTLKGDTLRGFIDYREWSNNPDVISFKHQLSDAKGTKYTPNDASYFNINNIEDYQKYTGPISMDVVNTDHLTTGKDTSVKMADVFLRILQKGKNVALYSYTDELKARYFIGDSPGFAPKELAYRIYEANDANGNGKTFTDETYLKQLNTLAIKYGALNDDLAHTLQKADYDLPSLTLIAGKINYFSKEELKTGYGNGDNVKAEFGFYAGAAINMVTNTPESTSVYYKNGGRAHSSYLPMLLFGINLPTSRNSSKVVIRGEFSVAFTKYTSSYINGAYPYAMVRASFNETDISFTPHVIYNFYSTENLKFYGGAGLCVEKPFYSNALYGLVDPNINPPLINSYYFADFDTRILLKGGIQVHKHLEVFFNYLTNALTTNGGYFQLNKNTNQLGVNYIF